MKTSSERGREARAKVAEYLRGTVAYTASKHPVTIDSETAETVRAWYVNPADCGASGKRAECLARQAVNGQLERCHGAGKTDISLPWLHKGMECKTGVFECTLHYETKAEADAVRDAFLAGGKLFKCRGYLWFLPTFDSFDNLGGARVITITRAETWLRNHPKAIVTKQATAGYWTVSVQNYRASMKGCEEFLEGMYYDGMDYATWLELHGED